MPEPFILLLWMKRRFCCSCAQYNSSHHANFLNPFEIKSLIFSEAANGLI